MAQTYSDAGLLPSATLQPYGQNILKYGIGQLGTPIDVSKLTPQVAGQSAFQQQAAQGIADLGGLGTCLLYTSPSPRDGLLSRMPSSA